MHQVSLSELIPTLQVAVGPVVLISGVGLLLLSMTNRLGRTIDRARHLVREMRGLQPEEREAVVRQLRILTKRATIIRRAIFLASLSVLFAAMLVILLFLFSLLHFEVAWLVGIFFILCMLCLIASLVFFIRDINQALIAVRLDLGNIQD